MTAQLKPDRLQTESESPYPYFCDGKPMSDNTEQYRWIVIIKENLEILFAAVADVFISGDLFWSPVKEKINTIKTAPDVMVVFGRPRGKRLSYIQHEEDNIPPQVVFEILSPGNTPKEMKEKFDFYQQYGVEEYYIYDPLDCVLDGWRRQGQRLEPILMMTGWVSPRLGIRFVMTTEGLEIYHPDGRKFLTTLELEAERQRERQRAEQAELRADREQQLRAQERQLRAQEQQRAEQAELERDRERQRADQLAARLLALGIDPDTLGSH